LTRGFDQRTLETEKVQYDLLGVAMLELFFTSLPHGHLHQNKGETIANPTAVLGFARKCIFRSLKWDSIVHILDSIYIQS
jgi:hypothetical protein